MSTIHTPDQRLRVFISSTMGELAAERAAATRAIERLRLTPVLFELGARPHPPRDLYLAYLDQSHVFIGIYAERYGWVAPGLSISGLEDEYRAATGLPKLVYVRDPSPDREERLVALLDHIAGDGVSYRHFATTDELEQLIADDLALLLSERFAATTSTDATATEPTGAHPVLLPLPANRFIGRDAELAELEDLLASDARLITLVGAGGIGKTRLALEAARAVAPEFPDGVRAVLLAAVREPDDLADAVLDALDVPEASGSDAVEQLTGYLRGRRMLIVLDNFEQIIDAAPLVADLCQAAPDVSFLVTSRELLHLSAERVVPVPPLPQAADLFLERARAVRPDLEVDDATLTVVAEICQRLDGLPLAVELAAARVRMFDPDELLRRLDRRLPVLTGGPRDLPERQRTLAATIAWSYDLLDDPGRELFDSLAVFRGSFALDSVEELCGGDDAVDRLASLVDRSLVAMAGTAAGHPRFAMLETVREFALQQLVARGALDQLEQRHAEYFLWLVRSLEPGYEEGREAELVDRFTADHANILAAITWFTEHGRPGDAIAMGLALWRFWWVRSLFEAGIARMSDLLELGEQLEPADRAGANLVLGQLALAIGDPRAASALETAQDLYGRVGDDRHLALASGGLCSVGSDVAAADRRTAERALAAAERSGDAWTCCYAEMALGGTLLRAHRSAEALPHLSSAVRLARQTRTEVMLSFALHYVAWARLALGDTSAAREVLDEALERAVRMDSRPPAARTLVACAAVALADGRPDHGAVLLGAAESARPAIGGPLSTLDATVHAATEEGLREALGEQGLRDWRALGESFTLAEALEYASST